MRALIRFGNGSEHWCIGGVRRDGGVVPWTNADDVKRHIARVNERNPNALELRAVRP